MEYLLIKGLDSVNGDVGVNKEIPRDGRSRIPVSEVPEEVRKHIAFNTLGYIKESLNNLERSNYFGENDGLYLKNIVPTIPIRVINLERRPDRWQIIDKTLREQGIKHHTRFNAVDGTKIAMNDFIKNLFRNNDFNYRQGVVGCALSHIQLWQELLNSKDDYMVILEDDIDIVDDFESKLNLTLHQMFQHPYIDLNFLGYFYWKGKPEKSNSYPGMKLINIPDYMGGFYGYVISKPAAMKLLHIAKFKGIQNGIDRFAHINFNKMVVSYCEPHIIHSEYAVSENSKDSDIQRNFTPVGSMPQTPVLTNDKLVDSRQDDTKSKIKVKPIWQFSDSKELCKYLNKLTKGNYTWNNIQLTSQNDADYFVIINKPGPPEYYDPKKTIIFHMEPWVYDQNKPWGVKTWGKWAAPNENIYYKVLTHKYHHNPLEWHLNKTYSELIDYHPEKNKLLSTFVSTKNNDEGHIKRLEFLKYMEERDEVSIDIYGNGSKGYKNGKGFMKYKDDGMFPYKYTICVENNSEKNYMTEKLADGILAECLCFYWGCPNVGDYIDSNAFISINLDNFEEAYNTIKNAIEDDEWSKRIDKIRDAKLKIMNELSIMSCIEKAIEAKLPEKDPAKISKDKLKIAFLDNKLTLRGTGIATYDYADYNETLLNNSSIIITRPFEDCKNEQDTHIDAYNKFNKRFPVFYYKNMNDVESIIKKEGIDVLYIIKYGLPGDGMNTKLCKTIIHSVFDCRVPHGDKYVVVSDFLNEHYGTNHPVLPHIVRVADTNEDMFDELNIPRGATVFGCYGGVDSFDVECARNAIQNFKGDNTYFIFMNINKFTDNTNTRFISGTTDGIIKRRFINTCNAMIHGRMMGETFGLACGEFSLCDKPVITYKNSRDKFHLNILNKDAIIYKTKDDLIDIFSNWNKYNRDVSKNGYKQYTPEKVMGIFNQFLT